MATKLFVLVFKFCIVLHIICADDTVEENPKKTVKPYKKWRKYIDCEVCRVGMAWLYKLNDELRFTRNLDYGEVELQNLMYEMCQSTSQTGKWMLTMDIIYNETTENIQLSFINEVDTNCNRKCKTIEASCKYLIDIKTDDIINFIWDKYNNHIYHDFDNDFIHNICNNTCNLYIEWKQEGKLEKALKKYNIAHYNQVKHHHHKTKLNDNSINKEELKELLKIKDNIQNIAQQFGYKYGDNKDKKIYDYSKKKRTPQERREQEGLSKEELEALYREKDKNEL